MKKREAKELAKQEQQTVNQNFIYAPQIIFVGDKESKKKAKPMKGAEASNFYTYDPVRFEKPNSQIFQIQRVPREECCDK